MPAPRGPHCSWEPGSVVPSLSEATVPAGPHSADQRALPLPVGQRPLCPPTPPPGPFLQHRLQCPEPSVGVTRWGPPGGTGSRWGAQAGGSKMPLHRPGREDGIVRAGVGGRSLGLAGKQRHSGGFRVCSGHMGLGGTGLQGCRGETVRGQASLARTFSSNDPGGGPAGSQSAPFLDQPTHPPTRHPPIRSHAWWPRGASPPPPVAPGPSTRQPGPAPMPGAPEMIQMSQSSGSPGNAADPTPLSSHPTSLPAVTLSRGDSLPSSGPAFRLSEGQGCVPPPRGPE